ncbi:MAG: SAM-dependent methyltransferase [Candidatus Endobugula sp.]|jgi:SAM-dependent methyltransferase
MLKEWLEENKNKLSQRYDNCFGVKPINVSQADIATWFASPLGKRILAQEKGCIDALLPEIFGYHLMQLSALCNINLFESSSTSHQFSVMPFDHIHGLSTPTPVSTIAAEFESLPIETDSIDVTLLHHALEFSFNPHLLLKEAARTIIPNGHIVIVGFNPYGLLGLGTPLACLLSSSHFYRRHQLRVARLKDWCKVLDLEMVYQDQGYYGLPSNQYHSTILEAVGKRLLPFMGGFYLLVLRKNVTPMTRIKQKWKGKKLLPNWRKGMVSSSVPQPHYAPSTYKQALYKQSDNLPQKNYDASYNENGNEIDNEKN